MVFKIHLSDVNFFHSSKWYVKPPAINAESVLLTSKTELDIFLWLL